MRTLRSSHPSIGVSTGNTVFDPGLTRSRQRSGSRGTPFAVRMKVYVSRRRLDRQIAAGQRCDAVELAHRAKHLTDPRTQRDVARNVRGVIRHADRQGPRTGFSSVAIRPSAVMAGRSALCELAEQLERAAPVSPRGVVLAQELLSEGFSPLFNPYCGQTVTEAVREVQAALQ